MALNCHKPDTAPLTTLAIKRGFCVISQKF